jgi:hypothetical protein
MTCAFCVATGPFCVQSNHETEGNGAADPLAGEPKAEMRQRLRTLGRKPDGSALHES